MERQNVTVSLPADVLREARHLAVDQGVSLSKLVASLLREKIAKAKAEHGGTYNEALDEALRLMREAGDHGTNGQITWTRDELHER